MAKLTVKELEAIKPGRAGEKVRDDRGLVGVIRATASGVSVKFDWRYRFGGKVRSVACGTWPRDGLPKIRAERDRYRSILDSGEDPAETKRLERIKAQTDQIQRVTEQQALLVEAVAQQSRITVRDLFERWAAVDLIRRKDGGAEVRRMFEKDVLPKLGPLPVEDVRKGNITAITDALLSRGVTRMAKQIFSLVRQMFRFAVDRDVIEFDPSASLRKAKIGGKDVERDRVLSEKEIRALHSKMLTASLMETTEAAVWICLSTCCRIGELLSARWENIDLEQRIWLIPSESAKNGKAHRIHLSEFAAAQLRRVQAITHDSAWCYPNRSGDTHVCPKTVTKQLGDRQRPGLKPMRGRAKAEKADALVLSGGKWTPHDLRRTGATMMVASGVLPEVAERCLNHVEENKVKRIYQRHSYEHEMREAWEQLGEKIEQLISDDGDKVVPIRSNEAA